MNTILVCSSTSNGNTRQVADALAEVLDARILSPAQATPTELAQADRIGFGSGIYWLAFAPELITCVNSLPDMSGRDAFVFATSGFPQPPFRPYLRNFTKLLTDKGFRATGTFSCRGLDTMGPFKLLGGVNKAHPTIDDLSAAQAFGRNMVSKAP
ncbi:flavodoxin family protein [Nocardia sp. 348MFTsu5.1]|uniref:flavodoxin family protein n=1 Tax=Nocardia sp. 348MFTsu5.1 TaxID=1172185 RepID=UPI00036CC85B|nr:flavodoxin family protein [Nocardia sp. 348MFTsu5.1]